MENVVTNFVTGLQIYCFVVGEINIMSAEEI